MSYRLDAPGRREPTLVEMARQALNILKKNQKGFVLLIEG
jgi:alkaline phosphatase